MTAASTYWVYVDYTVSTAPRLSLFIRPREEFIEGKGAKSPSSTDVIIFSAIMQMTQNMNNRWYFVTVTAASANSNYPR